MEKHWKQLLLAYSIETDPADLQELEDLYFQPSLGQFWHSVCQLRLLNGHYYIRSGCCFQCIQMDAADSQALSLWKNIGSGRWLAYSIEMEPADLREPEDLYFQPSLGWFWHSVCWLCSLSFALDSWYCFGTFFLNLH